MNPEDRLTADVEEREGRHTHTAGVCTAILSTSAEHVTADEGVERGTAEQLTTSAVA